MTARANEESLKQRAVQRGAQSAVGDLGTSEVPWTCDGSRASGEVGKRNRGGDAAPNAVHVALDN